MVRRYGYLREPEDNAKYALSLSLPLPGTFQKKYDLSGQLPDSWDQGQTGTCVAHGLAGAKWSAHVRAGLTPFKNSILFPYYNGRVLEGSIGEDAGMYIHDSLWVSHEYGFVPDSAWPFDLSKMDIKPSDAVYAEAKKDIAKNYASVDLSGPNGIKLALSHKLPVIFGMDVYRSFEGEEMARTGIMPMPTKFERYMGGHCMLIVGCDDDEGMGLIRNSWGTEWGLPSKPGYCKIPYEYLFSQHTSDGWAYRI